MKIQNICVECLTGDSVHMVDFVIRDDGIHRVICANGHESLIILSNPLFEILFDYGIHAFHDGYTRESVASMAASLERFYEFYVKVIQLKYGVPAEEVDRGWKPLSRQSERQLGSFLSLYLVENKSAIQPIDPEFRNKVIHRGKIPTAEEARAFGELVFSFLKENLNELKRTSTAFIGKEIARQTRANMEKGQDNCPVSSSQITTTFLSVAPIEYALAPTTFQAALDLAKTLNALIRNAE